MYKKPGKLVIVDWGDAWSSSGWRAEVPKDGMPVRSVGWVVEHNKKGILMAGSRVPDDGFVEHGRHAFIPAGMIRKIRLAK